MKQSLKFIKHDDKCFLKNYSKGTKVFYTFVASLFSNGQQKGRTQIPKLPKHWKRTQGFGNLSNIFVH